MVSVGNTSGPTVQPALNYQVPQYEQLAQPQHAGMRTTPVGGHDFHHPAPPDYSVMERVLFQLHHRTCHFGLRYSTARTRRVAEHMLLVAAIAGFGALILLHRAFVFHPKEGGHMSTQHCLSTIPNFDPTADMHHVSILPLPTAETANLPSIKSHVTMVFPKPLDSNTCTINGSQETCSVSDAANNAPSILYTYSRTKAFLMLPYDHDLMNHIQVQHIYASPYDPNCFGEPFLQALIHNMVGYDTIVLNWFLALQAHEFNTSGSVDTVVGHVYHTKTGRLQELNLPPMTTSTQPPRPGASRSPGVSPQISYLSKLAVLIQTSFLFFFSTTLVSFTLRETQERMLEFTQELSRRVSINLPLVDLVIHHLIHNVVFVPIMVGMMFFLIEFYSGDKFLAFLVMTIVWCVEVFSVISLRSYQGITFFPRMFFLLFCLFHIYYFANPYGFVYTSLAVVACFMWHSMVFFWHRYELPAVALGRVTVDRPRIHYGISHVGAVSGGGDWIGNPGSQNQAAANMVATSHSAPQSPVQIRSAPGSFDPVLYRPVSRMESTGTPIANNTTGNSADNRGGGGITRSHHNASFSTTSSRNSAGHMFRSSSGGEHDEDDDGSYVYFMEGEVVLHRQHLQRAPSRDEQYGRNIQSQPQDPIVDSVDISNPQEHQLSSVGLDMSSNHDDGDDLLAANTPNPTTVTQHFSPDHQAASTPAPQSTPLYLGEESTSGLQAILQVRLTPRPRNTSTGSVTGLSGSGVDSERRVAPASMKSPPTFPSLRS